MADGVWAAATEGGTRGEKEGAKDGKKLISLQLDMRRRGLEVYLWLIMEISLKTPEYGSPTPISTQSLAQNTQHTHLQG